MSIAFHNRASSDLADEYGNLKQQIAALEEQADAIKGELKARASDVPFIGHRWTVTISESVSKRLDTKALRNLLGDGLSPYEKESTSIRATVKPTMILGERAA